MRSFLTVLGVIIGTGTIIAVGSIIAGLDGAVTGIIRSLWNQHRDHFQVSGRHCGPARRRSCGASRSPTRTPWPIAARCPSVESREPVFVPNPFGTGPQINIARYKGNELYNARPRGNRRVLR